MIIETRKGVDKMKHYWIILLNNGTYKELVGTESYVDEWMKRYYPNQSYRKVIWDD
jgi:hypothetical protein